MKIWLHIGLEPCGAEQIQSVLRDKRGNLAKQGVLFPNAPGRGNHTRLYMALTDPDRVDPLRFHRGHAHPKAQEKLRDKLAEDLAAEIKKSKPDALILSCYQLSTLATDDEFARVANFLRKFGDDITVVCHVAEQADVLARTYAQQIRAGRVAGLQRDIALAGPGWHDAALQTDQTRRPELNQYPEIQAPPHWLDYDRLVSRWEAVLGKGSVRCRSFAPARFFSPALMQEIEGSFDLNGGLGKASVSIPSPDPSDASLAQARAVAGAMLPIMEKGQVIPRQLAIRILSSVLDDGASIAPGALSAVSQGFAASNRNLVSRFPDLAECLQPSNTQADWKEPALPKGFKAERVIAGFRDKIEAATKDRRDAVKDLVELRAKTIKTGQLLSETGAKLLPKKARQEVSKLAAGRFAPHNRIGDQDEALTLPQFKPMPPRELPKGSTGNVIVACMKNEAPYIMEWVAYHRAIGFDGFIIYTNDCSDGTDTMLKRLDKMGVVVHQNNDVWKGNSPQQHALNNAIKHPLVKKADWVAHIDVDEFVNVRVGNGTVVEFLEDIGDATNVAMTWRLFGHNGVHKLSDELVIEQFDGAAPKFCPKPHTVWGFKTMYRNIGAYEKISCHRTTKLREEMRDQVRWVNGSGAAMNGSIADGGWRSSVRDIGYDKIQLNHYALRSAESYLIKRQRGRALHVDRSIGLNYWLRMDFSQHKDVTIQRNLDRTKAEMARLMEDPEIARLHRAACDWHRAKADELHQMPEFEDLYQQAIALDLNDLERVAWCLANDLES